MGLLQNVFNLRGRLSVFSFYNNGISFMSKTKKYSNAGKGDKSRVTDKKKYSENWEGIFGKKKNKDSE